MLDNEVLVNVVQSLLLRGFYDLGMPLWLFASGIAEIMKWTAFSLMAVLRSMLC